MTTKYQTHSNPPAQCEICETEIVDYFIDGSTDYFIDGSTNLRGLVLHGPWRKMCGSCHEIYGMGFGEGRGQGYGRNSSGTFVKVEG